MDAPHSCYKMDDYLQLMSCMEKYTANLSSLVSHVGMDDQKITFNVSGKWRTSFGIIMKGRVFTLNSSYKLSHKNYTDFTFKSLPGGTINIEIHDPHFFLDHSEKLKNFPSIKLELEAGRKYTLNLDIVEFDLINKENRRCEREISFSFRSCIQV